MVFYRKKEVQAQLSSGKPAFESMEFFIRGIQDSKGLVGRVLKQL